MARIINENNEVIAKKESKSKKIEKKPITKTTLIVSIVLFVIAIIVIVVLVVYFTKDDNNDTPDNPTLLEQYIESYTNERNGKDIQLQMVKNFMDPIENYKGECYVLVYDTRWNTDNEIGSSLYEQYLNIDQWFVGDGNRTDGSPKSSMFDAFLGAGIDARFFVADYSTLEVDTSKDAPREIVFGNESTLTVTDCPMLIHVSEKYNTANEEYKDDSSVVNGVKILIDNKKDTNAWAKEIQRLTNLFLSYGEQ